MKKTICLVLVIIVLVFATSGVAYYFINKPNTTNDNLLKDENKNQENKENKEEQIKLSDEEIKALLSYIPNDITSVYKNKGTNLNTIDESVLLGMALLNVDCIYSDKSACPFDTTKQIIINNDIYPYNKGEEADKYIPLDYINELLTKMYNYELRDYQNTTSEEDAIFNSCMSYIYQDGYFIPTGGGCSTNYHFSAVEGYEIENGNLIIYERVATDNYFKPDNEPVKLKDYYRDYEIKVSIPEAINVNYYDYLNTYFIDYKEEFTKYKHTFKKNENGYYWFSTEVTN